jgi:hypothetical protein
MAAGDKEAAVRACVNGALKARGYEPPYDPSGTMNGRYRYRFETMIAFHRRVKACLATKGYAYGYPESQDYMNKTLVLSLASVYATVATQTGKSAHFEMVLASDRHLSFDIAEVEGPTRKNNVKTAKKAKKARKARKAPKKKTASAPPHRKKRKD